MKSKYSLPQDGGLIIEGTPKDIIHRYEKIPTSIFESEGDGVNYVADMIVEAIREHEENGGKRLFALGLTTGQTPLGVYRELVKRYQRREVSFQGVEVYSLDEFYPIKATEQQSRNSRIHEDFLSHVDIKPENVHIIDGSVPVEKVSEYCAEYDHMARNIDLMVIGFGIQGQIGFNEPGSYAKSITRMVQLTYQSRKAQAGLFFGIENTPKMAITMGLNTVMNAKKIVIMAWGEDKAEIVRKVVEGEATPLIPASMLQNHPNIEAVVDDPAADCLTAKKAPWLVGPCNWTPRLVRKAVVWLCGVVKKPILKLTYKDYIENSLGALLDAVGISYDAVNIKVFNDLQHTITGWPGGKPNADDSTRPVPSTPFPKRVVIFSPHPDDDVIDVKGAIRRAEARAAVRSFGLNENTNAHFLNLPFYETGGIKKGQRTDKDIEIIIDLLQKVKPHQIYLAGDLADPHGTHRVCTEAVLEALSRLEGEEWLKHCVVWLYRGAWMEWEIGMVDMAVPLSPDEMVKKRHAIYRHLSQKDIVPFPGDDTREFWQRAEERTQNTARLYDMLGMAEYQAIEVFVKMKL